MASRGVVLVLLLLAVGVALLGLVAAVQPSGGGRGGERITVYLCAAAKKVWERLVEEFERETGIEVEAVYGSSGKLLALIRVTGRGDVYAPASPEYMAMAVREGLVDPGTVRPVAYLVPAVIVPKGNPAGIHGLEDLARPGVRVAIGDPEHVVIGQYAVEILEYNGLWDRVRSNIVVYAEDAAKLAALVAMGAVDAVINWHVTHYWYPNRTEIVWLEPGEVPRVSYIPVAVLSTSTNREAAERFIEFITASSYARSIWRQYHYPTTLEEVYRLAPNTTIPVVGEILVRVGGVGS